MKKIKRYSVEINKNQNNGLLGSVYQGAYIRYSNPKWKNCNDKGVMFTVLEHYNKFIELLIEAGYKKDIISK